MAVRPAIQFRKENDWSVPPVSPATGNSEVPAVAKLWQSLLKLTVEKRGAAINKLPVFARDKLKAYLHAEKTKREMKQKMASRSEVGPKTGAKEFVKADAKAFPKKVVKEKKVIDEEKSSSDSSSDNSSDSSSDSSSSSCDETEGEEEESSSDEGKGPLFPVSGRMDYKPKPFTEARIKEPTFPSSVANAKAAEKAMPKAAAKELRLGWLRAQAEKATPKAAKEAPSTKPPAKVRFALDPVAMAKLEAEIRATPLADRRAVLELLPKATRIELEQYIQEKSKKRKAVG
ncbi:unnamed protein product [Polarella glacialis]|uniref:Uncharacterized protein n=2 Tax=Polarella glacialis TaxID=89957 RepID=A0A813GS79_POLGL|nr:unnamed protein product [Polarella glacialis]